MSYQFTVKAFHLLKEIIHLLKSNNSVMFQIILNVLQIVL